MQQEFTIFRDVFQSYKWQIHIEKEITNECTHLQSHQLYQCVYIMKKEPNKISPLADIAK